MQSPGLSHEAKIQQIFKCINLPVAQGLPLLITYLQNDPSPIVRHESAYVLGEINNHEEVCLALVKAILNDPNRFVIHEAMLALSNRGDDRFRDHIDQFSRHPDSDLASTAEISLQRLEMKIAKIDIVFDLLHLSTLLQDQSSPKEHRIQGAFKLLEDGSEQSIAILIDALQNESDPIVKHEIIFVLGETTSHLAVPPLLNVLKHDTNDFVLHETLLALATLGFQEVLGKLDEFASHPVPEVSESAAIARDRLLKSS